MSGHTYRNADVDVAGGSLRVGVWEPPGDPSAPTVLALHGITATHRSWMFLPEHLPRSRIVAPDLRGRGRSNHLPGPYGMRRHAEDLTAVLAALGLDRVQVIGHSMGAFVAVELAYIRPALVSELLLVDGGLPFEIPTGMDQAELTQSVLGPAIERLSRTFPEPHAYREFWAAHPAFGPELLAELGDYFDYELERDGDQWRPSARIEAISADQADVLDTDATTRALTSVRVPTTFVHAARGLQDGAPLYGPEQVNMWQEHLPLMTTTWSTEHNHYTIVMSRAGARLVAQQLSGSGEGVRR